MAEAKKEKKDKKDKKHKHSDENGVSKPKKEKSHSKARSDTLPYATASGAPTAPPNTLEKQNPDAVQVEKDGDLVLVDIAADRESIAVDGTEQKRPALQKQLLVGAMVPFANPLADEKTMKKVLRGVKRAAKHKALKRGTKEVVKALRKSPMPAASSGAAAATAPPGVIVLAADISPYDVISHIPVLCEDHNVPYIYVPSRAELGAAGSTKRPTSVVMVTPQGRAKKDKEGDDEKEDWGELYSDLTKVVRKAGEGVKV